MTTLQNATAQTDANADRRLRRSADPLVALHYQLSSARARGDLDAIVVADPSGVVVAGAGSWPVCEELAAYAPLLADGAWAPSMSSQVSSRVESLRHEVDIRLVLVGDQEVLLCSRKRARTEGIEQSEAADASIADAARGVSRILTAAA
jgi:hypothetical protein